jgi:hypothetical protein
MFAVRGNDMVDNINLNEISPLLSSTERVKSVDRRQRKNQQPPFKGVLQGKQKKKKKKKEGGDRGPSESFASKSSRHHRAGAVRRPQNKKVDSQTDQKKKIIDIRV